MQGYCTSEWNIMQNIIDLLCDCMEFEISRKIGIDKAVIALLGVNVCKILNLPDANGQYERSRSEKW